MGKTGLSGKERQISSPELIPGDVFKVKVLMGFRDVVTERLKGIKLGADSVTDLLVDWGKINVLKLSFKSMADQESLDASYVHYPDRNEDVWELTITHPTSKTSDNISSCSPIGEKVMLTHMEGVGEEEVGKQIIFVKGEWKENFFLLYPPYPETIEAFNNHQQEWLTLITKFKGNDFDLIETRLAVSGKGKYKYVKGQLDSREFEKIIEKA